MIAHCHGLLWEDYFLHHGDDVNKHVIDVMIRAQAVTAPSHWVAHAISRGMLVAPEVIYHGVDAADWATDEPHLGYVLWNKARTDPVSDPSDMQALAALLPDVRFVTTFGQDAPNVMAIGPTDAPSMKPIVQRAGVYLATTRETMGIGTIEALAAGVPVVGWDYGGQHEIVKNGETGQLVPFGDLDALANAVRLVLTNRDRYSKYAVADATDRWQWRDKIAQYADLYTRTLEAWRTPRPKVSVIITAYNLAQYLPDALTSVREQTLRDWECLIVDDCSTDDTLSIGEEWESRSRHYRYLKTPQNLGLSGARNYGWQHAQGQYIIFLDADDMLERNALDVLSTALDRDSALHIAYGGLDVVNHEGDQRRRNPWPGGAFHWQAQIAHLNQLPYCALMRRAVLERSGGYRTRDWRAEDAAFWSRVTSFGFRAEKVTDDPVLIYRLHEHQKSKGEPGDGDWTAWLPWRLAGSPQDGVRATERHAQPNSRIVPFGAQGTPPAPRRAWPVRHFEHPLVSVIIPVGPGHEQTLVDALDSVQAQTFVEWECLVVNNTSSPLDLTGSPWTRVIDETIAGAGAARNAGLRAARAPYVVFLDADDVLHPRFLEETLKAYDGSAYVYTDWATLADPRRIDGEVATHTVEEYHARTMLTGLRHAVTALIPIEWARGVGGFDEQLPCFEDWDFFCKLAIAGHCGARLAQPLLIYRYQHGLRTRTAIKGRAQDDDAHAYTPLGEQVAQALADRYAAWRTGEEPLMACGGCGGQALVAAGLNDMVEFATGGAVAEIAAVEGTVRMEFIGAQQGAQTYYGAATGQRYIAGRDPSARYVNVQPPDVQRFLDLGLFRIVEPVTNTVEAVAAAPQAPVVDRPRPKGRRG